MDKKKTAGSTTRAEGAGGARKRVRGKQEGRRSRKEAILSSAAVLFRHHGYHAVGIDEIGAAAGITGPGVYRHFPSKEGLLVAIFERVLDQLEASATPIVADARDAEDALEGLVANYVRFALTDRAIITVYLQEERNLPSIDRHRVRRRQRAYIDLWVDQFRKMHPKVDEVTAHALVHAVFGYITSVATYEPRLGELDLQRLLCLGAMQLLTHPPV